MQSNWILLDGMKKAGTGKATSADPSFCYLTNGLDAGWQYRWGCRVNKEYSVDRLYWYLTKRFPWKRDQI